MDHKEFQKLAIRTESIVDEVTLTERDLTLFMKLLAASGLTIDLLDKFKKHIFYGKELDYEYFRNTIMLIHRNLTNANFDTFRTQCKELSLDIDPRVFHALLGTITEHGEITDALYEGLGGDNNEYNQLQDDVVPINLDLVNVCEELGDSDWYKALFYEATDVEWDRVREMIIKKLEIRFSDKIFTEEEAKERDLKAEREILDGYIKDAIAQYYVDYNARHGNSTKEPSSD